MSRLKLFIPLIIIVVVAPFLYFALKPKSDALPSVLIGRPIPTFSLPNLHNPSQIITEKDLAGEFALINVWATWCQYCRVEHPFLMDLAKQGVAIYGLNWRDPAQQEALSWLTRLGNPYKLTIADVDNHLGLDLGVYGAPETFLIDPQGMIIYKYVGPLSPAVWQNEFQPKITSHVSASE